MNRTIDWVFIEKLALSIKLYITSSLKTQMNCVFLLFWADWAVRAVLKISAILVKFLLCGSYFHLQNKYNCSCQSITSLFIVLWIYNFEQNKKRKKPDSFILNQSVWYSDGGWIDLICAHINANGKTGLRLL